MASYTIKTQILKVQPNSPNSKIYELDERMYNQSGTIKELLEAFDGIDDDMVIPLPNVTSDVFDKIVEFLEHYKEEQIISEAEEAKKALEATRKALEAANTTESESTTNKEDPNEDVYEPLSSDDLSDWDTNFISQFNVKNKELYEIIMAANYLAIKRLLTIACKTVANIIIRSKTSEELREVFDIKVKDPDTQDDDSGSASGTGSAYASSY